MGTIQIRVHGSAKEVEMICHYMKDILMKTSDMSIASESQNYWNQNSQEVRRYLEFEYEPTEENQG